MARGAAATTRKAARKERAKDRFLRDAVIGVRCANHGATFGPSRISQASACEMSASADRPARRRIGASRIRQCPSFVSSHPARITTARRLGSPRAVSTYGAPPPSLPPSEEEVRIAAACRDLLRRRALPAALFVAFFPSTLAVSLLLRAFMTPRPVLLAYWSCFALSAIRLAFFRRPVCDERFGPQAVRALRSDGAVTYA